jgi:hypothetical protein
VEKSKSGAETRTLPHRADVLFVEIEKSGAEIQNPNQAPCAQFKIEI